jgi:release factor glutamine methyltransferase
MNIADAIAYGRQSLVDSESVDLDTRLLLAKALDKSLTYLMSWPETILSDRQQQLFISFVAKRQAGEPIAYIIGETGFWSLSLNVTPATLIPRPDTELLVELALTKVEPHALVLDLGTGSGAIALSIAKENPNAKVIASDYSWSALLVAQQNAERNSVENVSFIRADWLSACQGQCVDVVVSNPPYIENLDAHLQQGDVRFEPITALTAGDDGLDDIRQIVQQSKECLKHKGWLLVEHGYHQAQNVMSIFKQAGFKAVSSHQDLGGNDRVVMGQLTL